MALGRLDLESGVSRYMFISGRGHMLGLPNDSQVANATTGVPVASLTGFAPGALFLNYKGAVGSFLYLNTGTATAATWTNIL